MKVLVTGGTGYIGSHTVASLVGSGHSVRMLVRDPSRVEPALAPLGVTVDDIAVGDVRDPAAVNAAVTGCDAVIHAAGLNSMNPKDRHTMREVNEDATRLVLGAAADHGLDPIVHVSSYVALLPASGSIGPDSPVGRPKPPYSKTKARAETIAREFQERGAPVVITYPGIVLGPDDPYLGESSIIVCDALRGFFRVLPRGLVPLSDVRDVATLHAAGLTPGRGPRRYFAIGEELEFRALVRRVGELTGRSLGSVPGPAWAALAVGRLADLLQRVLPFRSPFSYEGTWITIHGAPCAAAARANDLGVIYRSLDDTLADTIHWLARANHIRPALAGALALPSSV